MDVFIIFFVFFYVFLDLMSKQKSKKKRKEVVPECLGSGTRGRGFLIKTAEFLPRVPRRSTRGTEF
jgi:hypothetical protein